jgi:GntR family transcriptional repressor for pyruvate dehydrogenase complex
MFTQIDNKKNFELIISQIMDLMREGMLRPGDRMAPERELAQMLNVSRSSLREAFKVLETIDLIEVKPREGTFLKEPSLSSLLKLLPMMLVVKQNEPHTELFEIRSSLEIISARLAAKRRTKDHLGEIEKTLEIFRTSQDMEKLIEADIHFHRIVMEATGNSLFIAVMQVIAGLMQYSITFTKKNLAHFSDYHSINYKQHYDIYMAIKERDEELAGEKMGYNLEYSYQKLLAEYQKIEKEQLD